MAKIICNVRVKSKEDTREWEALPSRNMEFKTEGEKIAVMRGLAAWHEGEVRFERRGSMDFQHWECTGNGSYVIHGQIPASKMILP